LNGTTARAPVIVAAIETVARRAPELPALIFDGEPVSYAVLARQLRALAAQFSRAGLAPGDTVGITLADERANILTALALIRLGCRQVALPPRDPAPLREDLARRLGLAAVVGMAPEDAFGEAALILPDIEAAIAAPDAPAPPPAAGAELVVGTSGTTGRPKLMVVTEPVMVDKAEILAGHGRVFLHRLGFDGNHGKRLTLRSLVTGGTEVVGGGATPEEIAHLAERFGVGRLHLQPQAASALLRLRDGGIGWPKAARLFTTGARIPQAFRLEIQAALGCDLYVQYGTTEAGMVSIAGPADHGAHPDSVGHLLPGVTVEAVDDDGRALPAGEEGLLRFRAPGAVAGYLDDDAANARHFGDGWFRPGDIGRAMPNGELLVAGRRDDMMTLGIIKIFPAEIEAVAEGFPGLADCAAFAMHSERFGDIPVLAAVGGPGFDAASLLAHCRARLGMRAPRRVLELPALPRNTQGKVLRRDLAALAGGRR
jgi:acyl-CoA synthetase (AMP-forming)/AMP-acid ligase II